MDRTIKIGGPAIILYGDYTLYTQGDIEVATEITTNQNETSVFGKTSEHFDTVQHVISFTPAPMVTANVLAALFGNYKSLKVGSRLYGATPDDLIIWTQEGVKHTYKVAALTGFCGLTFAANKPLFDGNVTFTSIGDCDIPEQTNPAFYTVAAAAFTDATYDETKEMQLVYSVAWGATPFDAIETMDGVKISFALETEDDINDAFGIYDKTITGFGVTAAFTPIGITEEDVYVAMGIQSDGGLVRGLRVGTFGRTLAISSGAVVGLPFFNLFGAAIKAAPSKHGTTANNLGELQLVAQRNFTAGVLQDMYSIGLNVAP